MVAVKQESNEILNKVELNVLRASDHGLVSSQIASQKGTKVNFLFRLKISACIVVAFG